MVSLPALHALHGMVDTVHCELALLVFNGDELVARVLRHVHEGLGVLKSGHARRHTRIHGDQVSRDHLDFLLVTQFERVALYGRKLRGHAHGTAQCVGKLAHLRGLNDVCVAILIQVLIREDHRELLPSGCIGRTLDLLVLVV